jgi:hypothetical protein
MIATMSLMEFLLGNYKKVSDRLGLVVEDGRIHGAVDGVPLQVWFGAHATHIGALLTRPAPVDLSIAAKGVIAKLGDLFGGHTDGIGDAAFDKIFSVKSSNVSRLAALFDSEARQLLLEAEEAGLHPAVDANSIHLRRFSQGGLADSEPMIESDFRTARIIGESFGRASR